MVEGTMPSPENLAVLGYGLIVHHARSFRSPCTSRFVDLATMAKVSVLVLDEKYHGWYLHCRSPYPRVSFGTHHQADAERPNPYIPATLPSGAAQCRRALLSPTGCLMLSRPFFSTSRRGCYHRAMRHLEDLA